MPILYFDPWTRTCVNDYRAKVAEKSPGSRSALPAQWSRRPRRTEARPFRHGILGGRARLLAGPLFADAARSAQPAGRAEIQSAAHLDAEGHDRPSAAPSPASIRTRRRAAIRSSRARRCRSGIASSGSPRSRTAWRCSAPAIASASCRSIAKSGTRSTPQVADGSYQHPNVDYQKFSIGKYRTGWPRRAADRRRRMFEVIKPGLETSVQDLPGTHRLLGAGLSAVRAGRHVVVPSRQSAGRQRSRHGRARMPVPRADAPFRARRP